MPASNPSATPVAIFLSGLPAERRKELERVFKAAGKKLDMGKACIRFQKADDLALDAIGTIVASVPVDRWVQIAQAARRR